MARKKKIDAGEPFADLLGKLAQVPKEEADAQFAKKFPAAAKRMKRPGKPKRRK